MKSTPGMNAYRVQVEKGDTPATKMSLYVPKGQVATPWDALMRVFCPGGQEARNLPRGEYRVEVFEGDMRNLRLNGIHRHN